MRTTRGGLTARPDTVEREADGRGAGRPPLGCWSSSRPSCLLPALPLASPAAILTLGLSRVLLDLFFISVPKRWAPPAVPTLAGSPAGSALSRCAPPCPRFSFRGWWSFSYLEASGRWSLAPAPGWGSPSSVTEGGSSQPACPPQRPPRAGPALRGTRAPRSR